LGPDWSSGGIIEGQYTVLLQQYASIAQVGQVPLNAQSIRFLAATNGPLTVSLANVNIDLISFSVTNQAFTPLGFPLPNGPYRLYVGDVSAFAGQTVELKFTSLRLSANEPDRSLTLDAITFSPEAVPEPSSLSLLAISSALVILRKMCRRTS
jgi:hypothetical protein